MPDYTKATVDGYHLYFTSKCIVEAFHAHADKNRSKASAAKFFIRSDGSVVVADRGRLSQQIIRKFSEYIAINYVEMYKLWCAAGGCAGYYRG